LTFTSVWATGMPFCAVSNPMLC